jgi:sarcosine oxidase subunit gamma
VAERGGSGRPLDARWERLPPAGLIDLQGTAAALPAFALVLRVELPTTPNQACHGAGAVAYWLAPAHWLVRVALADEERTAAVLIAAAGAHPAAVTIVSDAYAGFRLAGADASEVLAQGCPLDLDRLAAGACARSVLARAQALIAPLPAGGGYELFIERSHAQYVEMWLETALRS